MSSSLAYVKLSLFQWSLYAVFDTVTVFVGFIIPVPVHIILLLCKHGEMTIEFWCSIF